MTIAPASRTNTLLPGLHRHFVQAGGKRGLEECVRVEWVGHDCSGRRILADPSPTGISEMGGCHPFGVFGPPVCPFPSRAYNRKPMQIQKMPLNNPSISRYFWPNFLARRRSK